MNSILVSYCLSGTLSSEGSLVGEISLPSIHEPYTGDYEVTPKPYSSQILPTAHKLLKQDVVIKAIPYSATDNEQKGVTVCIGGEL